MQPNGHEAVTHVDNPPYFSRQLDKIYTLAIAYSRPQVESQLLMLGMFFALGEWARVADF